MEIESRVIFRRRVDFSGLSVNRACNKALFTDHKGKVYFMTFKIKNNEVVASISQLLQRVSTAPRRNS